MTVLDFGCGPGFFTVDIASMVGKTGKVIAADIQEGMLDKLRNKIKGTEVENRIQIHKCHENKIDIVGPIDVVIAFYVIHEVPNQETLLIELNHILKDNGILFLVEPKLFHVSRSEFDQTIRNAVKSGFEHVDNINIMFSRGAIFRKCPSG